MEVIQLLRNKNIRPSLHRVAILEYLHNNPTHPNVDTVYISLHKNIPTLSKTTVYNSLELFSKNGLVQKITIDGNEIRYDANTDLHGHFMCTLCKKIYDFTLEDLPSVPKELKYHFISEKSVYYKGICKECLKINNN
jgi:Fe2+ or Zn2+ uptake regulation protein